MKEIIGIIFEFFITLPKDQVLGDRGKVHESILADLVTVPDYLDHVLDLLVPYDWQELVFVNYV